jgi:hypothetical protein
VVTTIGFKGREINIHTNTVPLQNHSTDLTTITHYIEEEAAAAAAATEPQPPQPPQAATATATATAPTISSPTATVEAILIHTTTIKRIRITLWVGSLL